jgi:hypothetical protein
MRGYNPANESYDEWDRDRKARRWKYWSAIRKLNAEFDTTNSNLLFNQWVLQTFGIRIIYSNEGHITDSFTVVDEKKYLFFVLKYL